MNWDSCDCLGDLEGHEGRGGDNTETYRAKSKRQNCSEEFANTDNRFGESHESNHNI